MFCMIIYIVDQCCRLKNVDTNMETAMEFAPESFGQVVMLYIDCQVNGQPVKAFVDSGKVWLSVHINGMFFHY